MSDIETNARDTLQSLLDRMGLEAHVTASTEDGRVMLEITGEDVAVAIGAKGRTLDALQTIVGRIVNRGDAERTMIVVDGAGYRERRAQTLRELALKVRERVLGAGKPESLEGLSAAERRIVHSALAEAGGVVSHSEGTEPYRVLVIEPASEAQSTPSG